VPTLEDLDGEDWGEPTYPSHLVTRCHELRRKDIDAFSVEDFRILVGQGFGIAHLLPRVLRILELDPFAEGDFYPGDLLSALVRDPNWPSLSSEAIRVKAICSTALQHLSALANDELGDGRFIGPELRTKLADEIQRYIDNA
jgi:hypothetical protein